MLRLLALISLFLTCGLLNALNCYDCSTTGTMTCTATCTGATSCVYQVNVPLMASNQQLLRCEYNTSVNGCTGSLATNNVICYCTTDLCNKINTSAPVTVGTMGMSSTPGMGMAAGAMMPGGVPTMSAFGMPSVGVTLPPLGAAVQNGVASVNAVVPNVAMPGAMPGVMSSGIPTVPTASGQGVYQQAMGGNFNFPGSYPNYPVYPATNNQGMMAVPNTGVVQGVPQMGIAPMTVVTTMLPIGRRRRRNLDKLLNKFDPSGYKVDNAVQKTLETVNEIQSPNIKVKSIDQAPYAKIEFTSNK